MLTSIDPKLYFQEQLSENNGKRLDDQMKKNKGFSVISTPYHFIS
jgi:hypothetical protein